MHKMFVVWTSIVCLALYSGGASAAENVLGSCPKVLPMDNFNMTRFEGLWYVTEIFDARVQCMRWDISHHSGNVWRILETKESGISKRYNGKLYLNPDDPGALTVSWAANIGGGYPMTVYSTDYDSYAGIFMCQKVVFYSRQNGMVLSRSPNMPRSQRQATAGRLTKYNVPMEYFKKVRQSNCQTATEDSEGEGKGEGPEGKGEGPEGYDEQFGDAFGEYNFNINN